MFPLTWVEPWFISEMDENDYCVCKYLILLNVVIACMLSFIYNVNTKYFFNSWEYPHQVQKNAWACQNKSMLFRTCINTEDGKLSWMEAHKGKTK